MDNMNKINGHDVEYIVNGKTVIATIKNCNLDVDDYVYGICRLWIVGKPSELIKLPDTLKSIARCSPEDEFNLEVGKRIAYRRLQQKYWNKVASRLTKCSMYLVRVQSELYNTMGKCAGKAANIDPLGGIAE